MRHTYLAIIPLIAILCIATCFLIINPIKFKPSRPFKLRANTTSTIHEIKVKPSKEVLDQMKQRGWHSGNGTYKGQIGSWEYIIIEKE